MNTQTELLPLRWPDGWSEEVLIGSSPFNCLLVEGTQSGAPMKDGLRVVMEAPQGVMMVEGVPPEIKVSRREDGSVDAGPTGKPWVEFNGWTVQVHRALHPDRAVWVDFAPPANSTPSNAFFARAIADAAAYGGRWVVTLPASLAEALSRKEAEALETWRLIANVSRFFGERRAWREWEATAAIGIVSTFSGPSEFLSHEFVKLAARRPLPVRVLPASKAAQWSLSGLAAIAVVDQEETLPVAVESRLKEFSGRILRQKTEKWEDPYVMAEQVHLQVGREHDVVRLYNGTSANVHYTQSADDKRGVVHVFNFGRTVRDVTVAVNKKWRMARLYSAAELSGERLPVNPTRFGSEFALPAFDAWVAIELEA